jgi:ribonuclease P protein component
MPFSAQPVGGRPQRRNTFRKSEKLTRKADFTDIIKRGKKHSTQDILFYSRMNGLPQSRLGIAAPKRLGNAPVRNRCKRRLREIFRTNKDAVPKGYDILAVILRDISTKEFQALRDGFMQGLGGL